VDISGQIIFPSAENRHLVPDSSFRVRLLVSINNDGPVTIVLDSDEL
jgi:D-Tyr-tRNAtyr deacylase